jgi:hypothetical protein
VNHIKDKLITHTRALLVRSKTHFVQYQAAQVRKPVLIDQGGVNGCKIFEEVFIRGVWRSELQAKIKESKLEMLKIIIRIRETDKSTKKKTHL